MNIIVLVIDTMRYDHIAANGHPVMKTPSFDRLTESGWAFDRSYASSYPTIPHRTDALTGRYGAPLHAWKPLDTDVVTIPRALADAGYCTQLIHDTPHLVNGGHGFDFPFHAWTPVRGAEVDRPWLDDSTDLLPNWRLDPLFDAYDLRRVLTSNTDTYMRANRKRQADEDWNCARLWLTASEFLRDNARRDKFFLWVDCFDPHEPWDAPPEMMRLYDQTPGYDGLIDPRAFHFRNAPDLPEAAFQRVKAAYMAKASWVDRWLGVFLDTLEETGLAEPTAAVLTADHGTNVGERGKFGKGYPVREGEARTPFIVRAPGGGSGRSDLIVQPQDLFATVMALAGLPTPASLDSHDVLALAQQRSAGPRRIALAGRVASEHWAKPEDVCCTVFDGEWYLELTPDPERQALTKEGTIENVAADHPDLVAGLREAGIAELDRRGCDPRLVAWLRGGGEGTFPFGCRYSGARPAPNGWRPYFGQIYHEEPPTL
jgi:arylsulfatase A-like enzyme